MRKLNLENYTVNSKVADPNMPGGLLDIKYPYPIKDSILNMLFSRELKLTGVELVKQQAVALKIEACRGNEILLEDEEYRRIKWAADTCIGFARPDFEMIERINNAKVVQVKQK